jgi:superfamily II DNA or RNA helicase
MKVKMSHLTNVNNMSDDQKTYITDELKVKMEDKYSFGPISYFYPYDLEGDGTIKLPFNYGNKRLKLKRRKRSDFTQIECAFDGELRNEQQIVKIEATNALNKHGSVILSMYCGFGKTITSINLACSIRMKTLIIVNKVVLMQQWLTSINQFASGSSVQKILPKTKIKDCDFYIINAINVSKIPPEHLRDIGTVIVDEAHLIMAETISKSLHGVQPRYLIGLTATPYRPDGLDSLLGFYFGDVKIIRELYREHTVYKVETGFEPIVELTQQGKVNWNSVLDSQSKDPERNELIIRIIREHPERNFLVLVKRVEQGHLIEKILNEYGENVTSLLGSNQTYDSTSRILIGTCSKVGTGFDHPKLDTLLLAADVQEYFIQYLGRCMRTLDTKPVIFDLVDNYSLLTKHYTVRKKIYEKHGGIIKKFKY